MKIINVKCESKTSKPKFDVRSDGTWLIIDNHEIKIDAYPSHDFFQVQDILSFVARSEGF